MKVRWKSISSPRATKAGSQVGVAATVADVPLARRDDLERLVALLVEVGLALSFDRLAVEVTDSRRAATTASRALGVVLVAASQRLQLLARAPGDPLRRLGRRRPLRVMSERIGELGSRHHMTSVRSPKVQRMAMPAPLSISAARCAITGTSTPKSGEVTVVPKSVW